MTAADDLPTAPDPMAIAALRNIVPPTLLDTSSDSIMPQTRLQRAARPEGLTVAPLKVAPLGPDEKATLSTAAKAAINARTPPKPAKTVHLPPETEQLARLRERQQAEDDERRKSETDGTTRPSQQKSHADLASSPSSTVGPYSVATPVPPQESPDTSPDSDTMQVEVLPPDDMQHAVDQRREKEEHDRLLEVQKEIARKEAFGDEATPDAQLEWEAREAAAREAEEAAARLSVRGPEADGAKTEAEEVMEDVQESDGRARPLTPEPSIDEKHDNKPSVSKAHSRPATPHGEDEENIVVKPRTRTPPAESSGRRRGSVERQSGPRMMSRVSSGTRKGDAETFEASASQPTATPVQPKDALSPRSMSPTTVRQSRGSATSQAVVVMQTPPRRPRTVTHRTPANREAALTDLAPLKGAAEDPDRDYLEPLFRIQAHDSPNSRMRSLPDLVKSANKHLSTEDHFANLHERQDYRMLRRIYQLQNANKWSLRQMDKCSEPPPPVSHWDRIMGEMKWMRKDFKAERKMKKSVCAWLAQRCAEYVGAGTSERLSLRLVTRAPSARVQSPSEERVPKLEFSGESAPEDNDMPDTPTADEVLRSTLVVAPEMSSVIAELQTTGKLSQALLSLPRCDLSQLPVRSQRVTTVSKFVQGKIVPKPIAPTRKRSRFDYEDEAETLQTEPDSKRLREERIALPEDEDVALFQADNKHIRDRLHANNAFRPPSEFVMPSTPFYEFRNGSHWIWEDDQKLRKLAKEYTFNWSLIADEMTLPSRFKSSAERRTPWECFERWVELETLPAEMRKTMYFKTWFQRLEQSQLAADRRHQTQVAAIQTQAQANGVQAHVPMRRRTIPTRVEKRKNSRYLWLVDAMRKLAKKRESNAYKQAEGECLNILSFGDQSLIQTSSTTCRSTAQGSNRYFHPATRTHAYAARV